MSVTLFPMVHIGEADYFRQVYRDAFAHDVVLVEGVRSPVARVLTSSYRWVERGRLGLVTQPPYPAAATLPARIVQADLTPDEFHDEWRRVPLWLRLAAYGASPLIGLARRFARTRESLARRIEMEDRLSSDEILSWDPRMAALMHGILHARDARLLERLSAELERPGAGEKRLAIVYGASHMRAVIAELGRRRFRCVESAWQTVFGF